MSEMKRENNRECKNCQKARCAGRNYRGEVLYTCRKTSLMAETLPHRSEKGMECEHFKPREGKLRHPLACLAVF